MEERKQCRVLQELASSGTAYVAKAEDDVKNGRVAPISETFNDLCEMLQMEITLK